MITKELQKISEDKYLSECDSGSLDFSNPKLPLLIRRRFGCMFCEWRSTEKCPYHLNPVKDKESGLTINGSPAGICEFREDWLRMLSPVYDKPISYDKWLRDFSLALATPKMMEYLDKEQEMDKRLQEYETKWAKGKLDIEEGVYLIRRKNIIKEKRHYNRLWTQLHKTLLNYSDQQVNRETVKKQENVNVSMTPTQVADFIESRNKEKK